MNRSPKANQTSYATIMPKRHSQRTASTISLTHPIDQPKQPGELSARCTDQRRNDEGFTRITNIVNNIRDIKQRLVNKKDVLKELTQSITNRQCLEEKENKIFKPAGYEKKAKKKQFNVLRITQPERQTSITLGSSVFTRIIFLL